MMMASSHDDTSDKSSQGLLLGLLWTRLPESLLLLCILVVLYTRASSEWRFRKSLAQARKGQPVIPTIPYWVPGLYHLVPLVKDTAGFPLSLIHRYGWERPIRFRAAGETFTVIGNPAHTIAIYKNSRSLSSRSITERAAKYVLGVPPEVIPFYQADDSGMAAEVRKGSNVSPENRILYQQAHTAQKFLASPYLEPLVQRFRAMFQARIEALPVGDDDDDGWVEYPDLYRFCQTMTTGANIEAMMGTKILDLNPSLVEDFWAAKNYAPDYFKGLPRWLSPRMYQARDRIVGSIKKWHDYAFAHGDHTNTGAEDVDWDPIWGSKYAKIREQYMLGMKPLTPHVRAVEDWGLMFGANGNTAPVVFWLLFEALKDPNLSARMMNEVRACISYPSSSCTSDLDLDINALASQPLLQSVFAEVLRLRVSILVSRIVESPQGLSFGGGGGGSEGGEGEEQGKYTLRRGEYIIMPTDAGHFNTEAWVKAGFFHHDSNKNRKNTNILPLDQFDSDRFLVVSGEEEEGKKEFSQEGLSGLWIPFGGGDRMCPGRHLAKLEMLVAFACLFSTYDVELTGREAELSQVGNDNRYAAFGALPPDREVGFRIRRRGGGGKCDGY